MSAEKPLKIDLNLFQTLVVKKWTVSLILTAVMLAIYYGYILVLAFHKETLATKVGETMTVGMIVGLVVILASWVMTGIYVAWANTTYDDLVKRIRGTLKE